ncbi:hypothetical protein FACS1894199_07000 [Bacteroidia bacterium]|nr:hypothetical protein FACS1894199_07000 [Bacteroidia bacterium]
MKKQLVLNSALVLLAIGLMTVISCRKDHSDTITPEPEPDPDIVEVAVQFSAQKSAISGNVTTWTAGDKVGIYALKAGETLNWNSIVNGASNRQYSATPTNPASSATFGPVSADQTIHYPEEGNVDFIAYSPYKSVINDNVYPVNVINQSNQAALDVLMSNNAKNVVSSTNAVNLQFEHQLAKLVLHVKKGGGADSYFSAMTAQLSGLAATATLSLANGALTAGSAEPFNALKLTTVTGDVATFEATLIPTSSTAGNLVTFTANGTEHTWVGLSASIVKGNLYSYNVTITPWEPVVATIGGSISAWTEEVTQNSTANPKLPELVKLDKTGWTATASSTDASSLPGVEAVIDGVVDTLNYWLRDGGNWVAYPHWIIIDMKAPVKVGKIVTIRGFRNKSWFGLTRDLNYTISDDPDFSNPTGWADDVTGTYSGSGIGGDIESNTKSLNVVPAIIGRYIKLRMDGPSTLGGHDADICEIDVYGWE